MREGDRADVRTDFSPPGLRLRVQEGSDLRRQVDAALLSMREDGTYERIRQLWFGAEGSGGSEGGN